MPSNLNLDYYYGTEADQYSFYRIPKTLLTDPRYKSVSIEAKVLYGLLLDRMGLSVKNGWMDSEKCVYIYFTQEDAMAFIASADLAALPTGEWNILHLIVVRLLCAVGEPHAYAETAVTMECGGASLHDFEAELEELTESIAQDQS